MAEVTEHKHSYRQCKLFVRYTDEEWPKFPSRTFRGSRGVDSDTFVSIFQSWEDELKGWKEYYEKIAAISKTPLEIRVVIEEFEQVIKTTQLYRNEYVVEVNP